MSVPMPTRTPLAWALWNGNACQPGESEKMALLRGQHATPAPLRAKVSSAASCSGLKRPHFTTNKNASTPSVQSSAKAPKSLETSSAGRHESSNPMVSTMRHRVPCNEPPAVYVAIAWPRVVEDRPALVSKASRPQSVLPVVDLPSPVTPTTTHTRCGI